MGFGAAVSVYAFRHGRMVLTTTYRVFNLKTGEMMYNITTAEDSIPFSFVSSVADHGKIAVWTQHGNWLAYDMFTGKLAWRSETADYPWASSGFRSLQLQAQLTARSSSSTYDGIYAWNWNDGTIAWSYQVTFRKPTSKVLTLPWGRTRGNIHLTDVTQ